MSPRSYGFLITKELIFGFQILELKDHFSVFPMQCIKDAGGLFEKFVVVLVTVEEDFGLKNDVWEISWREVQGLE